MDSSSSESLKSGIFYWQPHTNHVDNTYHNMSEYFQQFFKYIKLPDSLNHQYSHRTPVECTLTTREGRRYIVTLRGNRFRVFFDEGWRDFVHGEDIMSIPINFWRDYILIDSMDTFREILEFEGCTYELQIVQGHGKILTQNWDAEDFVDATQMVEGDTWQFTLTPYFCVRFEVGQKGVEEGESGKVVFWAGDYPLGVFDIHAKTVYLDEDDREEAFEFWPLANHYCSNNPEPLWETLKIIFEPLGLDPYSGEMRARDERNHRKLDQVVRDYWAKERRMAAQ
ncbi:activin receptor type-2A [Striga asiatica]|uniref:Activin receptor type-2A n=1 Tax=Striga asiatica TaxID=4170 RepID=A0A5A7R2X3_STRAF|nr:activin receptor type-2A [Striga asiatica]